MIGTELVLVDMFVTAIKTELFDLMILDTDVNREGFNAEKIDNMTQC